MASRRNLKKSVKYIINDLYMESMICSLCSSEENIAEAEKMIHRVMKLQKEYISRISHTEPGNVKGFYKKFKEDFSKEISDIIGELSKLK